MTMINRFFDIENLFAMALATALTFLYSVMVIYFLSVDFHPGLWDTLGTVTALICVFLARTNNPLTWPWGIISALAMGIFFWNINLIGQSFLQIFYYIPTSFLGLYVWLYGGKNVDGAPVTFMSGFQWILTWFFTIICIPLIHLGLIAYFPTSQYIFWDVSIIVASLIGQYLLSIRKVEAWLFWIFPVNISAIGLYLMTDAYMFAALYVVFLINAVIALMEWRKIALANTEEIDYDDADNWV